MNKTEIFKKFLDIQKKTLLKAILKAKDARDNAPSAMESHSDTSRSQNEKLVTALELQLKELESVKHDVQLIYFEIKTNSGLKMFMIVPMGLGGVEIDKVRLLSSDSPLGGILTSKRIGNKFDFNNQKLEILKIE